MNGKAPLHYSIHIYPNPIQYASRIIKISHTISMFNKYTVIIFGIHAHRLPLTEYVSEKFIIKRIKLIWGIKTAHTFLKIAQAIEFYLHVLMFTLRKKINVVHVHTLSMLPLGAVLKMLKDSFLIYNIHELETEKPGWNKIRKRMTKAIEKVFIKTVDETIVVSDGIAGWYKNEYGIQPTVILNASWPKKTNNVKGNLRSRIQFSNDAMVYVYVGSLSAGRGIDLLLETFSKTDPQKKIIIFIGYGDYKNKVMEAQQKFTNIYFHPPVPYDQVTEFLQGAHFGFALIENVCLSYYYCLPTKIFDYISAGIPIICSDLPELRRMVEGHNTGVVTSRLDVDELKHTIENISMDSCIRYAENVRKIQPLYSWKNEEKKIRKMYNMLD